LKVTVHTESDAERIINRDAYHACDIEPEAALANIMI
jgi:hypothetical protein